MFYKNARIFGPDLQFHIGSFEVKNGYFSEVFSSAVPDDAIDLEGKTVIPGLIDVHCHGCCGHDFSDGDYDGLVRMAEHLAKCGVTSFAPASMSLPYNALEAAFVNAKRFCDESGGGISALRGIHMEGPFLSSAKRGAQNAEHLTKPDFEAFKYLNDKCGGLIKIVDIAPELSGAIEFIKKAKDICSVSIAHTDADYSAARSAIDAGATHLTHLFNAMPGIHHRKVSVIEAAAESENVYAEIICDGYHVHPAAIRLAFSVFKDRMILISDSGRCEGMPNGTEFELGGQTARLTDGLGLLPDGTIACSAVNLWQCLNNAIRFGIPEEAAVRAATYTPALSIGVSDTVGTIESGKHADFIICNADYTQKRVFIGGDEVL